MLFERLEHASDGVEIVDARGLELVIHALHACPAHAVLINAPTTEDLLVSMASAAQHVRDTPLIGCSVPRAVGRAVEAGALGHLVKPVTRAQLKRALASVRGEVSRVLVVDDDPDVLSLFQRMLHACDETLEVQTTTSGWEALGLLGKGGVDLLLLDVVMPEMDGWEVFERMAQDETMAGTPHLLRLRPRPGRPAPHQRMPGRGSGEWPVT